MIYRCISVNILQLRSWFKKHKEIGSFSLWTIDVPWYSEYSSFPHKKSTKPTPPQKTKRLRYKHDSCWSIEPSIDSLPTTFTLGFGGLALLTSSRVQISSTPQCGWSNVGEVGERFRKLTYSTLGKGKSSNIPWVGDMVLPRRVAASSPLKSYKGTQKARLISQPSFFRGELLNFGSVTTWFGETTLKGQDVTVDAKQSRETGNPHESQSNPRYVPFLWPTWKRFEYYSLMHTACSNQVESLLIKESCSTPWPSTVGRPKADTARHCWNDSNRRRWRRTLRGWRWRRTFRESRPRTQTGFDAQQSRLERAFVAIM